MDNLFEQMANISKANGYDILAVHVKELKEMMRELIEAVEKKMPENELNPIINKAKILSL